MTTPAITSMRVVAPSGEDFTPWPLGWTYFAASAELSNGPVSRDLFGRSIACYRTADGTVVAMDGRCWHMGADLGQGEVVGDCLRCPFHGWKFGPDGACRHVPAQPADIPPAARQTAYATAERRGRVYVFPSLRPTHPLPFFEGVDPVDLVVAPPFELQVDCPWWLVGTNGFDLQHFGEAHDRRLVREPVVSTPHPAARRIVATFAVSGDSWRDRLTRRFSGPFVEMDVMIWAGALAFVQAKFRQSIDGPHRTTTYGAVEIAPAPHATSPVSVVRVTVGVRQRRGWRAAIDWCDARVRSHFITAFLKPDTHLLKHARYRPERLIDADRVMSDYLVWLASVCRDAGPVSEHFHVSNDSDRRLVDDPVTLRGQCAGANRATVD